MAFFVGIADVGQAQAEPQVRSAPQCPQIGMLVQASVRATRPDLDRAVKRLAYVKQALAITLAEESAWEGYANAVTVVAGKRAFSGAMMIEARRAQTAPEQMRGRIADVEESLAGLRAIQPFEHVLYDVLTLDQKSLADKLVSLNCVAWDTGS